MDSGPGKGEDSGGTYRGSWRRMRGSLFERTKYFLDNFNKECDNEGIEISEFEVVDFILACEGVGLTDPFAPSLASSIEVSDYVALPETEKDEFATNTALCCNSAS
ncbi:hypothetical protein B0H14DRAFT_2596026 [Mycena olivaceomarginata]|nr:hypothetical protein B0H14DRAFT_2596026 [Mycena olivaceomarginata]